MPCRTTPARPAENQVFGGCSQRFVRALFEPAGGRPSPHGGGITSVVPPAAVIASFAAVEKAWAFTVRALVTSPRPSTFTRPRLATRPRSRSVSGSTVAPVSKPSRVSRFTTWYSTRNGLRKPLAFGTRRVSGVCPPSNPGFTVSRAPVPFMPRPAVLPPLPPMPRPTRRGACFEPGAGFRSWILIVTGVPRLSGDYVSCFVDPHEMRDLGDHAPDLRAVGQLDGLVDLAQPERTQGAALLRLRADPRAYERDPQRGHVNLP